MGDALFGCAVADCTAGVCATGRVSPGEIDHVLALFPDIDRQRILYTPNFAPRSEYEYALERGVWVTLDNLHPLREWGELFAGHDVFLRLDTGQGRGHHEHVRTAGIHSKFGIPLFEVDEVRELAAKHGARIVGLHAHTGSGILQADNWEDVAATLIEVAGRFADVRILDLGGGLGVPEKPGQDALDMSRLDASVSELKSANPQYELWLEPGRYVSAEAGVLLASVTQTKGKGDVRYVGVSTGMNSLIRPALYGAYHEISNLTRLAESPEHVVTVVGPICETGDKLGTDRLLPNCVEGDILLIANAGAYGYVTAWPCDESRPTSSTLNFWPGAVRANTAVIKLSKASGEICLYQKSSDGSSVSLLADAVGFVDGSVDRGTVPTPPPPSP